LKFCHTWLNWTGAPDRLEFQLDGGRFRPARGARAHRRPAEQVPLRLGRRIHTIHPHSCGWCRVNVTGCECRRSGSRALIDDSAASFGGDNGGMVSGDGDMVTGADTPRCLLVKIFPDFPSVPLRQLRDLASSHSSHSTNSKPPFPLGSPPIVTAARNNARHKRAYAPEPGFGDEIFGWILLFWAGCSRACARRMTCRAYFCGVSCDSSPAHSGVNRPRADASGRCWQIRPGALAPASFAGVSACINGLVCALTLTPRHPLLPCAWLPMPPLPLLAPSLKLEGD
jgi:hypothetical protein